MYQKRKETQSGRTYTTESWRNENGRPHRIGGPSCLVRCEEVVIYEEWCIQGMLHREDGPARIRREFDSGETAAEWYYEGQLHRVNGPALTITRPDGTKVQEIWYQDGLVHRIGGPADLRWNYDGLDREIWVEYGFVHRLNGPAMDGRLYLHNIEIDTVNEFVVLAKMPLYERLLALIPKGVNICGLAKLLDPLNATLAKSLEAGEKLRE